MPLNSQEFDKQNLFIQDEGEMTLLSEGSPELIDESKTEEVAEDERLIDLEALIEENSSIEKADSSQFSLLSVLGQGSFGKVYMVRKDWGHRSGEYFAMKVLRKAFLKVRDRLRTRMERDILASIKHPFIVQLHFAFQTEGKLFLVIDLVPGGDLFGRLSKEVMFTEEDAKLYLAEIAMALDHLHSHGIIYRDLKPENILLAADGHIKLTDFGLCKESIPATKKTYSFCGTIEYMAPEIIMRKGHGPAADWWSFGVLMYEMLSGTLPFRSANRKETMNQILRARLMMPPRFSSGAQKLVRQLFKRTPETRLGYKHGLQEIQTQPFFEQLDFKKLYKKEIFAPFRPAVPRNAENSLFFNKEHLPNNATPGIASANARLFKGFSFVAASEQEETHYTAKSEITTAEEVMGCFPVRTSNITTDYDIFEIVGTGSYSVVHRAVNKANGQKYAIKIVDRGKRDCHEEIDILLRYSEHPNLATFRDVFATEERYYLVMEYLRGGDLLNRINQQKSYSEKEAASLMEVIVSAIAYLHEHGVVHRDLKPSNILFVDDSGRPESVRINDFGFAKQMRTDNGLLMTPCYTANYVAPEVLQKQGYDASCDIWSLGIVLYAMISGTTPYMNNDMEDPCVILERITHGQINLDTGVWTKVSADAKDLISSMVHINPALRPTASKILQHPWIVKKNKLSDVRLQKETWRLTDAMKSMFSAFNSSKDVKSLTSIKNSAIMKRRAGKKEQNPTL